MTAVDASEEMLAVARQRAAEQLMTTIKFQRGDAHALDFADRSFDAVVSLRVLMHTPQWRRCVAELCRVAERLVIVDYPVGDERRAARVADAARDARGRREDRAVPRVHASRSIAEAFDRNGFRIRSVHRQFVLPIALHKAIGSRAVHRRSTERAARSRRPAQPFGSPVTARGRTVRVLVTGATGFTGGHLARALAARGDTRVARWCATIARAASALGAGRHRRW